MVVATAGLLCLLHSGLDYLLREGLVAADRSVPEEKTWRCSCWRAQADKHAEKRDGKDKGNICRLVYTLIRPVSLER